MSTLLRWALRGAVVLVAVACVGVLAWRWWRLDPAEVLASLEVPPAPTLSPEQELATFRIAPGFRVELVAAEPLVVDPVAMDWDDEGRLYVVEMRGFMGDIDGGGEERPVGRVVVLEDTDGDGRMDRSDVFLDELVMPRAVAVLSEGVLVGAPPDLWLCRDTTGDRACNERTRLAGYATDGVSPEHRENGLLAALDGWIYNAKSTRRFRLRGRTLEVEPTVFRGQWGIAQDDAGLLYYNHNSAFLYGDAFPAEALVRQPGTAASSRKAGVNVPLSEGAEVFGIRIAPGLNRAYMSGTLRSDGRQKGPTAVSGLAIQRGNQYGPEYVGDAFVPEAGGSALAHFAVEREGLTLRAEHRVYPDETWGEREFLASTDERFRPVDADFGPDGAIWLIDMYRGVIQHAHFVSDHLRRYVEEHGLAPPGATGRIWRIVRTDRPLPRRPPPLDTLEQQLAALDHPNGWVRDRAQRRIVFERADGATRALRALGDFGPLGRRHALFALANLGALDAATWRRALADDDPEIRKIALRIGDALYRVPAVDARAAVASLLGDRDEAVRLQALHALGSLPLATRPLETLLAAGREGEPIEAQGAISGLAGLELRALQQELVRTANGRPDHRTRDWIAQLALAAHLGAREHAEPHPELARLLDIVANVDIEWQQLALLAGIDEAQRTPGSHRIELPGEPALFDDEREASDGLAAALKRARRHFTWPGDPSPGGARPLTPDEEQRRERGRALFAGSCAACHGADGRGLAGLAPPLVGSPWVRDSDDWLLRIALHGLTGPLHIDGEDWNATMPGHGHDPRFDDEALAGLATHLRRSWGHAGEPVTPEAVARVRTATAERKRAWTVDELLALDVGHRFDDYVGLYEIPIVGFQFEIKRDGSSLMAGVPDGPSGALRDLGDGLFTSDELTLQFEQDEAGAIESASATRENTRFTLSKVN
jgi:mono/diheme cytochrome c family protein/glucose/arabinose dehydrogenase